VTIWSLWYTDHLVTHSDVLSSSSHSHRHAITCTQPLLLGLRYLGEPVPEEIFFWTLWCKGRYRGRHTVTPDGRHSIRTNQQPTSIIPRIFTPDALLPQPSQFILAWDRQQICWLSVLQFSHAKDLVGIASAWHQIDLGQENVSFPASISPCQKWCKSCDILILLMTLTTVVSVGAHLQRQCLDKSNTWNERLKSLNWRVTSARAGSEMLRTLSVSDHWASWHRSVVNRLDYC